MPAIPPRILALAFLMLAPAAAAAQQPVRVAADILFFGDNTEFRNPFREGETILGAAATLALEVPLGDRLTIVAGGFGVRRFGSDRSFDLARPVLTLRAGGPRSTFLFGTLIAPVAGVPAGPDRTGPHGLLPAIQRETLAFERPYEAGLQWRFAGKTVRHDMWINWQQLNTPAHRERFDVGVAGEARVTGWLSVPFQAHIVHEGGQLFASGPVNDSSVLASGVSVGREARGARLTLETYGLVSRYVPDRAEPDRSLDGRAILGRAAAERSGWRGHALFFRGRDFIKVEGDPNYMSLTRGGARYIGTRDYSEAGIARTFRPAPEALIETSARLHRIEGRYEYSFRVMSAVSIRRPLRE
ncbi:MAG: hypothetical protein M3R55_14695 [Acidobacteriota bacterium]|nr:hypothetical protein [Acidobacteriota bacterium]